MHVSCELRLRSMFVKSQWILNFQEVSRNILDKTKYEYFRKELNIWSENVRIDENRENV